MVQSTTIPFTIQDVELAPDSHGVYTLYDHGGIIYIGRAAGIGVSIRSRLKRHALGDEGACTKVANHFWYEVTDAAITRERELLEWYSANHSGKLPRCNERVG